MAGRRASRTEHRGLVHSAEILARARLGLIPAGLGGLQGECLDLRERLAWRASGATLRPIPSGISVESRVEKPFPARRHRQGDCRLCAEWTAGPVWSHPPVVPVRGSVAAFRPVPWRRGCPAESSDPQRSRPAGRPLPGRLDDLTAETSGCSDNASSASRNRSAASYRSLCPANCLKPSS